MSVTRVLVLLPFPIAGCLHLSALRSLRSHGIQVHLVVETMDASPHISDPLDDFLQAHSLIDLSIEESSSHFSILEENILILGISTVIQIGASTLYPLLPNLKITHPQVRLIDLLLNPYDHYWDHFLFENVIDTVIVESGFMLNFVRASTMRSERDIRIVRSGIRVGSEYQTEDKHRPLTIGFAGRLSQRKAPLEFVKVAHQASQRISADFKIFGKGPMEREVRTAIRRADLHERISVEEVPGNNLVALSSLDILVVPSRFDARPTAIMEAAALGVVTVAAGVGGIPEMIHDGANGFCLTPWNVPAAVERLCTLAEDKRMLDRMKAASRIFARTNFDYDKMVQEYAQILRIA